MRGLYVYQRIQRTNDGHLYVGIKNMKLIIPIAEVDRLMISNYVNAFAVLVVGLRPANVRPTTKPSDVKRHNISTTQTAAH